MKIYIAIVLFLIQINQIICQIQDLDPNVNKHKRAILIGIDGTEFQTIDRLIKNKQLTNMPKLYLSEAYSGGIEGTNLETLEESGPMWTTILYGIYANKHHCGMEGPIYPNEQYKSIFRMIREENPTGQLHSIVGWNKIKSEILEDDDDILYKNEHFYSDDKIAKETINSLQQEDPYFLFMHFNQADDIAHKEEYGEQYDLKIKQYDYYIGQILEEIKQREQNKDEEWLLLISTDHGRYGNGKYHGTSLYQHYSEKHVFIASSKELNDEFQNNIEPPIKSFDMLYGYPSVVQIVPTILSYLGIKDTKGIQKLDGIPMHGEIGLQKLMPINNVLYWNTDQIDYLSPSFVKIFNSEGILLDKIQYKQGKWPITSNQIKQWENNKEFKFQYNNITVWYSKEIYLGDKILKLRYYVKKGLQFSSILALLGFIFTCVGIKQCLCSKSKKVKYIRNAQQQDESITTIELQ